MVGLACVLALKPLAALRFDAVVAITTNDAAPGAGPTLPRAAGAGVAPTAQLRVVLIDGAGIDTARAMPAWDALCARGLDLTVDVGFPTVSMDRTQAGRRWRERQARPPPARSPR